MGFDFWSFIKGQAKNPGRALKNGIAGLQDLASLGGRSAATDAANQQRGALDAAMKRLQESAAQQYTLRMGDLDKTMEFYGPAQRYLESIYGGPASAPGGMPGVPAGPGPARSRAPATLAGATPPGFPKMPPSQTPGPRDPRRGF